MKVKVTLFLALLTLALVHCTPQQNSSGPENKPGLRGPLAESSTPIGDKMTCEEQGGKWEQLGFEPYQCNLPAPDAGQSCRDSGECSGMCLPASSTEMNGDGMSTSVAVGVCSEWTLVFGCFSHILNGKIVPVCLD